MNATPAIRTASPGRIEFIGNHTDYNGGQVLGVSLNLGVEAEATPREDRQLHFSSDGIAAAFKGSLDELVPQSGELAWANYPLGILKVLLEAGHEVASGCDLHFRSNLPTGAGLSSSAAIELATLEAICQLNGLDLSRKEKVLLAQRAENTFVGVPCGMLDQAVSCFGREDHLVRIDCANTAFETVPLAHGLHFWVFNTNHKHSLVDSMYSRRHAECRKALEILRQADPGLQHLAHARIELLEHLEAGSDIRRRAEHTVLENLRVQQVIQALEAHNLEEVGDLLFASHASSRDLFENSIPELDTLVELLQGLRSHGVIGARLTGGGFGGAVMALTTDRFSSPDAGNVLQLYRHRHPGSEAPTCLHVRTGNGTRRLD